MAVAGVGGATPYSSSASRGVVSSNGLFGKSGIGPPSSSATETDPHKGGQRGCPSSLASAAYSGSPASPHSCAPAGGFRPPQEVALETLQHELLEEVLARWERRLERRVEQFTAVAEEVESVEKAMIEESRKIQQVMNEQGKLERKQIYTAGVIDWLEHQQHDLMALLRSIEAAVLELRCGGPREISCAGKKTNLLDSYSMSTAAGTAKDAEVGLRLRKGASGDDPRGTEALVEPDSRSSLPMKLSADQIAPMPLLSAAEQLALERLSSFDQQLAEVGQNLSYTAEAYQAGRLGAVAQVLAVHQAALRAAAHQAAHIGEHMSQLQEAWDVSRDRSGSGAGFLRQSG